MAGKSIPTIDDEAIALETALKSARIPEPLHVGFWDIWVKSPTRAHSLITRFKDNGAPQIKAAPNPLDAALERLGTGLRAAYGDVAAGQIIDKLAAVMPSPSGPATSASATDSKTASKPPKKGPSLFDQVIQALSEQK